MAQAVRVRKRTWQSQGRQLATWMLDFTDHHGERQRRVVKHPDAPWSADDLVGLENGKHHAVRQAHKVANDLTQALLHHNVTPMIGHSMTVLEMVQRHIDRSERQENKCRGLQKYLERMPQRRKRLAEWNRQDSIDLVRMMADNLAQATLVNYWGVFRRAWAYAYNSEMVARNPTEGVKATGGRASEAEDKNLRPHELQQLLSTPYREDVVGIFKWMLASGCYYADMRNFKRSNIMIAADGQRCMSWKRSKTARPTYVYITDEMLTSATGTGDQLFPVMPWSIVRFNQLLKKWAEAAGIYRDGQPLQLSQKWARKTCGNLTRAMAPDPWVHRDLMAHKEIKSTQHYVQPNVDEIVEVSSKWNQAVYRQATQ
jgi:integrase